MCCQWTNCFTPTRNSEVQAALSCLQKLYAFSKELDSHMHYVFNQQRKHCPLSLAVNWEDWASAEGIFNPVLPIFADTEGEGAAVLGAADISALVAEQHRSVLQCFDEAAVRLTASSGSEDRLLSAAFLQLGIAAKHLQSIAWQLTKGLDYLEDMLCSQLVAAIGRVLTPADFASYMAFHYRKVFVDAYAPQVFDYAVRRSAGHSPEGNLRIDADMSGSIATFSRSLPMTKPMEFAVNASTRVRFSGQQHLHCWLGHGFTSNGKQMSLPKLQLVAHAK